ncbi:sugar ABC transporter ATP-binding protein [Arsenicitalea aurantiaca]|uniref:Sugar ABC transporter ATP-binding protein n=2 Tax=Arsenicitalea aurantiaca TaxID=1783274 RepID=A0A433XBL4_9HYPH|nr:sugar ABC transporter ATP-binding protein [Arsenicitalea aurantiaca]RUT31465.1 sugar ABC transporter ATP-binding protein [Arsenicitalea aurantiaca]
MGYELDPDLLLAATDVAKAYSGVPALIDGRIRLRRGSVHALCGGNGAGKSTFLNILMGLQKADSGTILAKGRVVRYGSAAEALADGVAIITQELSPVLDMTVAENIYLGREPRRGGWFVDKKKMVADAAALFARLKFDIDPRAQMRHLSVAKIQLVEIAKAISRDSDILIMDEPTSAIGEKEAATLFAAIASLREQGVGIIYVSHRLTDIFSIADDYTVFRDGRFIETGSLADIDRKRLISLIVGRDLADQQARPTTARGETMIAAEGFSRDGQFEDISVSIARGEIVGLYGLMGAGRSEFANALYGNGRKDKGTVTIEGRPVEIRSPTDALAAGIAMITEDRKETGLVLTSTVSQNVVLAALKRFARGGFVSGRREAEAVDAQIKRFRIRTASRHLLVQHLSGGNQQKVVLARCIETDPKILICDEPTRGIDEGAKREIYAFLSDFAAKGNAVLLISSEIPEILANADRIIVFRRGRIAGELPAAEASQDALVHLAS